MNLYRIPIQVARLSPFRRRAIRALPPSDYSFLQASQWVAISQDMGIATATDEWRWFVHWLDLFSHPSPICSAMGSRS